MLRQKYIKGHLRTWLLVLIFALGFAGCGGGSSGGPSPGGGLKVSAAAPSEGSSEISPNQKIAIQFDQQIDVSTVNNNTIILKKDDGTVIAGTIEIDETNNIVIFTPSTTLDVSSTFHLVITTGVKSASGITLDADFDITFTTAAVVTTTAPEVVSATPSDTSVNVATDEKIKIQFNNQTLDVNTLNSTNIILKKDDGTEVPIDISFDMSNNVVICTPQVQLDASSNFHLEITTGVQSLSQISLASNFMLSFSTGDHLNGPTVSQITPADAATAVALDTTISVKFSEDMYTNTITSTNLVLKDANNTVVDTTVTFDQSTHIALITPKASLTANTTYHVTVTTNVKNSFEVSLQNAFESSFTTGM